MYKPDKENRKRLFKLLRKIGFNRREARKRSRHLDRLNYDLAQYNPSSEPIKITTTFYNFSHNFKNN